MTDTDQRVNLVGGGSEARAERPPARTVEPSGWGFTDGELASLHATYRNGACGTIFVAVRRGERIITLALPPVRSEELLYRQMRGAAKCLKAARGDGWLLTRRVIARTKQSSTLSYMEARRTVGFAGPVKLLLVQTRVRIEDGSIQSKYTVGPLDGDAPPTFYVFKQHSADDRVVTLLSEASGHL